MAGSVSGDLWKKGAQPRNVCTGHGMARGKAYRQHTQPVNLEYWPTDSETKIMMLKDMSLVSMFIHKSLPDSLSISPIWTSQRPPYAHHSRPIFKPASHSVHHLLALPFPFRSLTDTSSLSSTAVSTQFAASAHLLAFTNHLACWPGIFLASSSIWKSRTPIDCSSSVTAQASLSAVMRALALRLV